MNHRLHTVILILLLASVSAAHAQAVNHSGKGFSGSKTVERSSVRAESLPRRSKLVTLKLAGGISWSK